MFILSNFGWALFLIGCILPKVIVSNEKRVVCYFGSWATYRPGDGKFDVENINPSICTHLMFGFAGLGTDNKIIALDPWNELEENWGRGAYKRATNLKIYNPKLKVLLAIGGWNEGSEKYSKMAASSNARRIFINSVIPFLQKHNFDGLDLDWEYPTQRGGVPADRENFVTLCQELRDEFDKHGLLVTAAVSAGKNTIEPAYDIPALSRILDFINVMAYDFRGAWPHHPYTGHHSAFDAMEIDTDENAFFNLKYAMELWKNGGAAAHKLVLGMPSFGRGFILQDPSNTGFYSPATQGIPPGPYTREPGYWGYNEICLELAKGGWTQVRNEDVVGPYAYKNNLWIGFDDADSIKFKCNWIKSNGYGGAMFWSLETDDFLGKCGQKNPLIGTAYRTLIGQPDPDPEPIPETTTNPPEEVTEATPPSGKKCEYHGQFLGELCDSKFYRCIKKKGDNWDLIVSHCRHPLYYDPSLCNCNWGDAIGCF